MTDVITSDSVASVSLNDAARDPEWFSDAVGVSFEEYGFAIIRDHGISQDLIDDAEAKAKAFFALPEETKRKYLLAGSGGARGYTAFGVETAKGATAHDLKEFWHVGRELAAGHKFRDVMGDNVWPEEVPGFKETFLALYEAFDEAGLKILRAVARYLKVDEDYFTDTVRDGNSVMRLLHYPPIDTPSGNHIRAGAHEDINTITLLLGAEEAGLELKTKDGRWLPVSPKPGELVVNIGDMLQRLTNGRLRSTSHRVVNPAPDRASKARYSMPFFLHFRPDFVIEALPGTVPGGEEPKWPPISSHEYLLERLREIKLA
ncbi:2-oxoglutarate and iron-dependent oxygenase domain-containing protein [Sphingomonas sp. LY29]|uniref:isopenicillin N synthase family dioxygenase n=1 Tax=unclassified Sphingomonas TaxID=196159 RepID=UPI002ADEF277|nr:MULTISPECIES: 2-oxoglutarate and iron-dependent oxygenase domain-containing protein [unclassified Sphingomonas]MEA1070935.1 2-oxoglutarate and iron-dependent oxygenase domain-containing protein [Sphingomonas sp. LY160]WRP26325.1 2-oxoglutarate and iron-dependent oxygenase domain-containing protein [Sphingomonas sp. LY29]